MKDAHNEETLTSVLNGMDALIAVCDHQNFDVLFLNDAIRKKFNIKHSGIGEKCYKILQGLDAPCPTCPHKKINLDAVLNWEHHEVKTNAYLYKSARLIKWSDNRIAHLEYAVDITDLRREQEKTRRLEAEVNFDPLTEVYSRHYFEENINTACTEDDAMGLMMIDIDFFKQYNDEYGHLEGDHCLKQIAQIIKSSLRRKTDFVARFGGEEFVVVLPGINEEAARIVAEMILLNIVDAKIPHIKSSVNESVTVSIGVAIGICRTRTELLEVADRMLYKSKNSGRNQYHLSIAEEISRIS
jgi:diguanylate cyclase (GGDEF)-like protein